jgi:hypothetical protein
MAKDFLTIDRRKLELTARRGSAVKVQEITFRAAAIAAATAPGHMKEAVRPIFTGSKANPVGIIMVDHPAASFVLHGTKPHIIRPRQRKMLRFSVGGQLVFARLVHHPGTKPNNFLWEAVLKARAL